MNRTASSVKGVLDNMRTQLQILEFEIKGDTKSKAEFEKQLVGLDTRKIDLQKRVDANTEWLKSYDRDVGPFQQRYKEMTSEIADIYANAKKGHAKGIVLLQDEFGYHVPFKRPGDTFTAVAFRPA